MRTGTELTDSDFVSFDLVDENNMLTNAGMLLADESPDAALSPVLYPLVRRGQSLRHYGST